MLKRVVMLLAILSVVVVVGNGAGISSDKVPGGGTVRLVSPH